MYILTTSVYDNDGVNVEYECGHGNTRYGHVLNMTIESYECKLTKKIKILQYQL